MSDYVECNTEIKEQEALVAALADLIGDRSKIKIYDDPIELKGSYGRKAKAHIIVPKQYAGYGAYSRDIGFERMDNGKYRMWVTDMPGRGKSVERDCKGTQSGGTGKLMQNYAKHVILRKLKQKGRRAINVSEKDGQIQIKAKVRLAG